MFTNAPIETPPRGALQTPRNNHALISTHRRDEDRCGGHAATTAEDLLIALSQPLQLSNLEQDTIQRRTLLQSRIQDLYQRVVTWLSTLTTEVIQRETELPITTYRN